MSAGSQYGGTSSIINHELKNLSEAAMAIVPTSRALQRRVQRQRRRLLPEVPTCIKDLHLTDEWRETTRGDSFILFDGLFDEKRLFIFTTSGNLQHLSTSKKWYGDGTFSVSPPDFEQLYTIHGDVLGEIIPLLFCLLPDRKSATYKFVLQKVLNELELKHNGLVLETFGMDFEKSMMKAIDEVFCKSVDIEGCFFHFAQCHWRKIQKAGLTSLYASDAEFATCLRMLTALAFVPVSDIPSAFEACKEVMPETADAVVSYIEKTYVGTTTCTTDSSLTLKVSKKKPKFKPAIWSVYDRVVLDMPRTTNKLEGWHRRFSSIMAKHHPNIYEFIGKLKEEQHHTEMSIMQLLSGAKLKAPKPYTIAKEQRIKTVVQSYHSRDIIDYLRGVAHNIRY